MESAEGCFERIMPVVLLIFYALAWGSAGAGSPSAAIDLMLASALVTLPFFLMIFFTNILGGKIVALFILFIGLFIPLINILLVLLMVLTLIYKFQNLTKNLPFILLGAALYLVLLYVAPFVGNVVVGLAHSGEAAWLVCTIMGGLLFWFYLKACFESGHKRSRASALALGSACYLALFLLFLFLPGAHDGVFEGDSHA